MNMNKPNLKYRHIYLIVRIDKYTSHECYTCVSAWWSEDRAHVECERLNAIKRSANACYHVEMTRLKDTMDDA
jgi:hypothetical protein